MADWLFSFIVLLFNILNKSLLVLLLGFKGFNIFGKRFLFILKFDIVFKFFFTSLLELIS